MASLAQSCGDAEGRKSVSFSVQLANALPAYTTGQEICPHLWCSRCPEGVKNLLASKRLGRNVGTASPTHEGSTLEVR